MFLENWCKNLLPPVLAVAIDLIFVFFVYASAPDPGLTIEECIARFESLEPTHDVHPHDEADEDVDVEWTPCRVYIFCIILVILIGGFVYALTLTWKLYALQRQKPQDFANPPARVVRFRTRFD